MARRVIRLNFLTQRNLTDCSDSCHDGIIACVLEASVVVVCGCAADCSEPSPQRLAHALDVALGDRRWAIVVDNFEVASLCRDLATARGWQQLEFSLVRPPLCITPPAQLTRGEGNEKPGKENTENAELKITPRHKKIVFLNKPLVVS